VTHPELARLREQLGELLSLLEDEQADPAALVRAMQSCSVVFDALKSGFPLLDELDAGERERLAGELESTLRLNAVALGRAAHAGEGLARGISHAKQTRSHARALATGDASGSSYDLSA